MLKYYGFYRKKKKIPVGGTDQQLKLSHPGCLVNKNYAVILYIYFYTKKEKNNYKSTATESTDNYNLCGIVCSALRLI